MAMKDVGPSLGPQLMDKIGDVIRFIHKDAITAFAGADPGVNDSGDYSQKSVYDLRHRPGQRLPHPGGHPEPPGCFFLAAQVVSCTPVPGGFAVVLDRTAFFPEGGGQP